MLFRPTPQEDGQGWQRRGISRAVVWLMALMARVHGFDFLVSRDNGVPGKPGARLLTSMDVHYVHGSDMILDS